MANYDLSSQGAIEQSSKLAAELAGNERDQGSYNAAWLHGYASALKDCAKQLEPMQRLVDGVLNYLGEHYDSSELNRMFREDMGMTDDEITFLGFDSLVMDMAVDQIGSSEEEYPVDFENGFKIQKLYANRLPEGCYGDIYTLQADAEREHPGAEVMVGYCVVDTVARFIPDGCSDWNDTLAEAEAEYEENVLPYLAPGNIVVHSWKEMQLKYQMDRDEMTVEEEEAFVADCFKLYEKEGFSPRYWSPFTDDQERVGLPVEIVGRIEVDDVHHLSCLPMWKARLDGCEFEVFPEEVVPSEMRANGCRWFEEVLKYDNNPDRWAELGFNMPSPQEVADVFGAAVKDGDKYYLPKGVGSKVLEEQIAEARAQVADSRCSEKMQGLEI